MTYGIHGMAVKSAARVAGGYMYYLDALRDKDGSMIYRTKAGFRSPLSKHGNGEYRVKSGEMIAYA